jgi:hypothetical protein
VSLPVELSVGLKTVSDHCSSQDGMALADHELPPKGAREGRNPLYQGDIYEYEMDSSNSFTKAASKNNLYVFEC